MKAWERAELQIQKVTDMVYHATRVTRTLFRKLPRKSHYWLQSDTKATTEPHFKFDNTSKLSGQSANGAAATTAETITAPVIRVPCPFLGQVHVNA